ncbi:hypothetical protein BO94DRAFT_474496 [Aspergillus sclerotioniger CBS 115572]|uniref:Uncharacterized protein n=1 Tax=Aspergillus sclerotioniger CBS 115572 TaxID=1450535 RepID=A0A317VLV9_9EURO|nr:hypothetical protein BO94DRAFT_474496 [Aspergillus sclerotioniger CBS 115572]PWY74549.1 hypothetical protein BO94DRAFT_474496 [Aspergillus sclerotioniger CBS 115572]
MPPAIPGRENTTRNITHQTYLISHVWFYIPPGTEDPHVRVWPQYHHGLWVQKSALGTGDLHHVIGSISDIEGMKYECKTYTQNIISEPTFCNQIIIGYLTPAVYDDLKETFSKCPRPTLQKFWNHSTGTTEPADMSSAPIEFYTERQLVNFRFPALTTGKEFVEEQLLRKAWELIVPFDVVDMNPSGLFPQDQWIPQEQWWA